MYAGATAGSGVEAAAGLGGATGSSGAVGGSFAAASSGASAGVVQKGNVIGGGSFSAGGTENTAVVQQPHKEVIERTVIPNYVEKTIQVPTYVEKTIRVPTVVEQRVRVPVEPTVIEKTVSTAPAVVESTYNNIQTIPVVSTKHTVKVSSRYIILFNKISCMNHNWHGIYLFSTSSF